MAKRPPRKQSFRSVVVLLSNDNDHYNLRLKLTKVTKVTKV